MNKLLSILLISTLSATPAFASGNHNSGHGSNDESKRKPSNYDNDSSPKQHQHGDKQGPVGSPAQPSFAKTSIQVSLTDSMQIKFHKDIKEIKSGEVIQFIVTNKGKIPHEFSVGNQDKQKEHAEMMRTMPSMVHADGNTITVQPGETRALTWHFEGDDLIVFACNIPGHYESGMFKKVVLIP